jgi:uncharacterized protein (DUF362 family)
MNFLNDGRVALVKDTPIYSKVPPYHPSEKFPEWSVLEVSSEDNPAYRSLRQLFHHLQFDVENFDKPNWNPLGELIQPGNTVVLKPNFVSHRNLGEMYGETDTDSLVTHGSVIRAVLDYSAKALQGHGKIIIGDCPIQGTDWSQLTELVGLDKIQAYFQVKFPDLQLIIKDYRLGKAIVKDGAVVERIVDEASFFDYQEIDLQDKSLLIPIMEGNWEFGVSQYPKHRMKKAHTPETNKYLFPKDFIYADVIINLPKMKSHMKAGVTCALKNFVGINGHKDYLPHFRFGSPKNGGDEYPDGNWLWDLQWFFAHWEWELDRGIFKSFLMFLAKCCSIGIKISGTTSRATVMSGGGGWYGNDTLWRTVLDINRAFFYFDRKAQNVTNTASADVRYLAILDGLVAGHKESPLAPTPLSIGVMMASLNPLAMDAVATAMMGLDIQKLKQIDRGFDLKSLPLANFCLEEIKILGSTDVKSVEEIYQQEAYIPFEPSQGFIGHVEYHRSKSGSTEPAIAK